MCGIFSLSRANGTSSFSDGRRAITAGLIAIEHRGPDSTGVAWTRGKAEKVWYHKLVGPASKVAHRLELGGRARIHTAIGHARWASHGAVNYTNGHPVVADNICLVHNGVLTNHEDLIEMSGRERVGEVDSWAMAALLAAQHDLNASHPAELLDLVEGDAAIAWIDADDPHSLHLARLDGRPMTIGFTQRGDLVMSSTPQSLRVTGILTGVRIDDITPIDEHTYLRVVAGGIKEWSLIGAPKPKRPKRQPRGYAHGITDLLGADRDWDAEAQTLFGERPRPTFEWDEADPWRRKK
jgi:glucosamine--fructose-6-phosphate aminotransferase (isomerizing)